MNESQQRKLAKRLREKDIYWLRELRWNQLGHDLACVDFRLKVEKDVKKIPDFALEDCLHEAHFRRNKDSIQYTQVTRDGQTIHKKKGVIPDFYFVIVDEKRKVQGQPARARLLVEIDGTTHSNPRFGREKVVPGIAYIKSPQYKARFGANSGRWLVLTGGIRRLRNLLRQTHQVAREDAKYFFFTTFKQFFGAENGLLEAIWWQTGKSEPVTLFDMGEN
jgi:hypothetical protein